MRVPQTVIHRGAIGLHLGSRNNLRGIALVLSIHDTQEPYKPLLLSPLRSTLEQARIQKILEARQGCEPILTTEFIEAGHAVLTIADDIKGHDVELARSCRGTRQAQVLQEARMVLQR